jgi:hypothetical protein
MDQVSALYASVNSQFFIFSYSKDFFWTERVDDDEGEKRRWREGKEKGKKEEKKDIQE